MPQVDTGSGLNPGSLYACLIKLETWQAQAGRVLFDLRWLTMLPPSIKIQAHWQLAPTGIDPRDDAGLKLQLQCREGKAEVLLFGCTDQAWFQVADEGLPEDERALILDIAVNGMQAWLQPLGLNAVRVQRAEPVAVSQHAPEPRLELQWTQADGAQGGLRVLASDPRVLISMRNVASRSGAKVATSLSAWPAWLKTLRLPGRLLLGERRLPISIMHSLVVGDVLIPSMPLQEKKPLGGTLVLGTALGRQWHAPAQADGTSLTLTGDPKMADPNSQSVPEAAAPASSPIGVNELEIPINFEIETATLTVSDLASIKPGYVLELPVPARASTVRLVAYGQVVGHGELVTVGEQLGVRITQMGSSHAAGTRQ